MTLQCSLKSGLNQSSKQEKQQNFWKAEVGFIFSTWIESPDCWLNKLVKFHCFAHSALMFLISYLFDFVLASLFLFISIIGRETFESLDITKVW